MGRKKLHKTPEERQQARSLCNAAHYAKNKSRILLKCRERYRARDYKLRPVETTIVSGDMTRTFVAHSGPASPSELDFTEIQNTLAQLHSYLGDGGLSTYAATLSEDLLQYRSSDAWERPSVEVEKLRELRDKAHAICVKIWERDGATNIWENSRQLLRPFQEALDAVNNLLNLSHTKRFAS